MANAAITTIIPTYRRPQLLRRAIESVLAQSFRDLRICIYDNASGDETEDVVRDYMKSDCRIDYVKNGENLGAVSNIMQGVKAVDTAYYSVLNDDDFLLPAFYERALMGFERYPESEFVCAKTVTVDLMKKQLQLRNRDWLPGFYVPSNQVASKMCASHFTQTGVLLKKRIRERIGLFEKSGDDMLYMVLAAASSPFSILPDYGAVFTVHPKSYTAVTGLRGGDILPVYEALLTTVGTVLAMSLPAERKLHLLMLVVKAYGGSLDGRRLSALLAKATPAEEMPALPVSANVTAAGIVAELYEQAPRGLRPILRPTITAVRSLRRALYSMREKHGWLPLPDEAYQFCLGESNNLSGFVSSIHAAIDSQLAR